MFTVRLSYLAQNKERTLDAGWWGSVEGQSQHLLDWRKIDTPMARAVVMAADYHHDLVDATDAATYDVDGGKVTPVS